MSDRKSTEIKETPHLLEMVKEYDEYIRQVKKESLKAINVFLGKK